MIEWKSGKEKKDEKEERKKGRKEHEKETAEMRAESSLMTIKGNGMCHLITLYNPLLHPTLSFGTSSGFEVTKKY